MYGRFSLHPDAYARHEDTTVDRLYQRLRQATPADLRMSIWRELEHRLLVDQVYVIPIAATLQIVRAATQTRLCPLEVRFALPREGDLSEYERYFGCPVRLASALITSVLGYFLMTGIARSLAQDRQISSGARPASIAARSSGPVASRSKCEGRN